MARTTSVERLREQAANSLEAARKAVEKAKERYAKAAEKATEAATKRDEAKTKYDEAKQRVADLEAFAGNTAPATQTVEPEGADSAEEHGEIGGAAEVEDQPALV